VTAENQKNEHKSKDEETLDLRVKIAGMKLPEKIKAAMFGDANYRLLLVTDPNRMIQACVLKNPQLQDREIVDFSKNPNLSEFVIRIICDNRKWLKMYEVKRNLLFNPKTPAGISTRYAQHLNKNDIRRLAKSKGIPQALVNIAKKLAAEAVKGGGG
jgi:Asp-tRNA(Asn)/Glu-tRNA(Gln) amidotransferase B subunit